MPTQEVRQLNGKILKNLCNYSDQLLKKDKYDERKVVQECIQLVHQAWFDIYGPKDSETEGIDTFGWRKFETDGYKKYE